MNTGERERLRRERQRQRQREKRDRETEREERQRDGERSREREEKRNGFFKHYHSITWTCWNSLVWSLLVSKPIDLFPTISGKFKCEIGLLSTAVRNAPL